MNLTSNMSLNQEELHIFQMTSLIEKLFKMCNWYYALVNQYRFESILCLYYHNEHIKDPPKQGECN